MPVIQRGQSFQATVNHKGARYRRQFPTEIEARAWEAAAKLALSKGGLPDMGEGGQSEGYKPSTLRELAEYILAHRWRGTKAEKTTTINLNTMVKVIGGETKVTAITSHTINMAVQTLRDMNYPENTINKKLSPLRVCLKYAADQNWINRVPDMPFFKVGEGRIRWFTDDEEQEMLSWCISTLNYDLWDYIIVSLDTGLRQGEVLSLKPRNLGDGRVTVWGAKTDIDNGTKAGTTRVVPLTARAKEVLQRRATGMPNGNLLFPYTKDVLTGMWNRMRIALGYDEDREYVPHAMRHTFCTRLVKRKINLAVIQKLAGHLRIETTLRYVHVDDDVLVEAIQSLAPRLDQGYTDAGSATPAAPHANVACHKEEVAGGNNEPEHANVLKMQRNL